MTFRTRVTCGFLACGLLPLIISACLTFTTAQRGLTKLQTQGSEGLQLNAEAALVSQRTLKSAQVETYFNRIRDQVLTFAEDQMIVDAMSTLTTQFEAYDDSLALDDEQLRQQRQQLRKYYAEDFSSEYRSQNNGENPAIDGIFAKLDSESLALQNAYISGNPNPLGSKLLLNAANNGTDYDRTHAKIHPIIRSYLEKFGYYDIFLVDIHTGDIVYTVFKELDFATSLIDGPYADTNFAECYRRAAKLPKGEFAFVDFAKYTPSYESPASFIAAPIFNGDQRIGVALFQMPVDKIIAMTASRVGLGESGETVMLGPDHLMRNDSFQKPETHNLVASFKNSQDGQIATEDVELALAGEQGITQVTDYRGVETLSAYGPVDVLGVRWALITKIDRDEAFAAADAMAETAATEKGHFLWFVGTGLVIGFVISIALGIVIVRWLSKALLEVDSIAQSLSSTSQQLAIAADGLSQGAQKQASNLEETAASLEEITSTVQQNAANAEQANELSTNARDVAEKGGSVTRSAVVGMSEINTASTKISNIITTIDEIAFQTNLLSLNAAVEAARAGEQGRGFAVVAGEVRTLAQRSAEAAKEIKLLIDNTVSKVDAGSGLVHQSGESLDDIVTSVKRVKTIVGEIATASREQAMGIEQVNIAVSQMDHITQTNASQTEQLATTADTLASQAHYLRKVVAQFNLTNDRSATPSPHSTAPVPNTALEPKSKPHNQAVTPVEAYGFAKQESKQLQQAMITDDNSDHFEEF